ncbi:MAG: dipeptidase [Lentisphaerae bacterium]|nr:dipeptidase [Lentisphaerota bacterium]
MHPTIERARQAGLAALQPSARDLEYGLALHRRCLVIDGYGFGAMGAADPARLRALAAAGASERELADAREDGSMTRWASDAAQFQEAAEAWEAAGVDCVWINAGEESNEIGTLFKRLGRRTYACDLRPEFIRRAACPEDIPAAKDAGRRCLTMTANGVPLPQRWESVEDELSFIRPLFQLGVRMAHLVYQRSNPIGQGCGEPHDAGLTDFGRAVVAAMNRVGMIVDVAHAGMQTSLDAARCSDRPMVASHTVCHGLHPHFRGKNDAVMRAIADTGGCIGICAIGRFLGGTCDLRAFLDHVQYALNLVGPDHVSIGTDVAYAIAPPPSAAAAGSPLPARPPQRPHWRSLWPEGPAVTPAPGADLSLAWTNVPLITVGMVQRGLSDEVIAKVMGGNCLRVAKALWDGREP